MHETVCGVDQTRHTQANSREVVDGKSSALAGLGYGLEHNFDKLIRVHTGIRDGELLAHHILAFEIQNKDRDNFVTQFHASDQMRPARQFNGNARTAAAALGLLVLGNDLFNQAGVQKFRCNGRYSRRAKAGGLGNIDSRDFPGGPDRIQYSESPRVTLVAN